MGLFYLFIIFKLFDLNFFYSCALKDDLFAYGNNYFGDYPAEG